MQTKPTGWASIFAEKAHKIEYRFVINGVNYQGSDLKEVPIIRKPLLDKPALGRCCTASLQIKVYPKGTIPKAATVDAYCRLRSANGNTVTDWLPQGKYYISTRSGSSPLQLNCLDCMVKAGTTYRDKSAFTSWPRSMTAVVNEICSIMGVSLDARTVIKTGPSYSVDYPNDDILISEVLGWIAAAHGGNWIITESGKLRLVVLSSPAGEVVQSVQKSHKGYTDRGKLQTISRVTLEDDAENVFTSGGNTGLELKAECRYATQDIVAALCSVGGVPVLNGCVTVQDASITNGAVNITGASIANGKVDLQTSSVLYGVTYQPYTLTDAYLDPAIELGDTISCQDRTGTVHTVVVYSMVMACTMYGTCSLSAAIEGETEDEYPYLTVQQRTLMRTVRTDHNYFGNRINRSEGFISERVENGAVVARLTANASVFSMQSKENGAWVDRIYFDGLTGKYVITGDVTIQGLATFITNLANGTTTIDGGCIKTGTIEAARIDAANLQVAAANITGTLTASQIDATNLHVQFANIDGTITVAAANITGQLTASQINTTNLQVAAANITGTLTASQIDTTNLQVAAANITGTLTASQIDATNLHVSGANVDNLTVTNAMIDTLYASKIVGGSTGGYISAGAISDNNNKLSSLYATNITVSGTNAQLTMYGTLLWGANSVLLGSGGVKLSSSDSYVSWSDIVSGSTGGAVFG